MHNIVLEDEGMAEGVDIPNARLETLRPEAGKGGIGIHRLGLHSGVGLLDVVRVVVALVVIGGIATGGKEENCDCSERKHAQKHKEFFVHACGFGIIV